MTREGLAVDAFPSQTEANDRRDFLIEVEKSLVLFCSLFILKPHSPTTQATMSTSRARPTVFVVVDRVYIWSEQIE